MAYVIDGEKRFSKLVIDKRNSTGSISPYPITYNIQHEFIYNEKLYPNLDYYSFRSLGNSAYEARLEDFVKNVMSLNPNITEFTSASVITSGSITDIVSCPIGEGVIEPNFSIGYYWGTSTVISYGQMYSNNGSLGDSVTKFYISKYDGRLGTNYSTQLASLVSGSFLDVWWGGFGGQYDITGVTSSLYFIELDVFLVNSISQLSPAPGTQVDIGFWYDTHSRPPIDND